MWKQINKWVSSIAYIISLNQSAKKVCLLISAYDGKPFNFVILLSSKKKESSEFEQKVKFHQLKTSF